VQKVNPTYFLIRELQDKKNWNVQQFTKETRVPRASYYRLISDPVTTPKLENTNAKLILKCHRKNIESPWKNEFQICIDNIHYFEQILSKSDYERYLKEKKCFIKNSKYKDKNGIEGSAIEHIEGLIGYQLRFVLKLNDNNTPKPEEISASYKSSMDKLIGESEEDVYLLKHILNLSSLAIYFMSLDKKTRSHSNDVRKKLIDEGFIGSAKEIIKLEEWNWKAARNGLIVASVLQYKEDCEHFWTALKNSHQNFVDPSYTPSGLPSILNDPDAWWFVESILKP
jgi:hypothetical protein